MTTSTPSSEPRPRTNRQNGVVYTPPEIAAAIADAAIKLGYGGGAILEPSVGDGAFIDALLNAGVEPSSLTGADTDPSVLEQLRSRVPKANFHEGDFVAFALAQAGAHYRLVIGNPPYIRRTNFEPEFSKTLDQLAEVAAYSRAQLKNAWAAFVVAAESLIDEEGMMAFVVPYELLNVDYGVSIQKYLSEHFSRIDIFVPEQKAFRALDQDAVVFFSRRRAEQIGTFVHYTSTLDRIDFSGGEKVDYSRDAQISLSIKSFLIHQSLHEELSKIRSSAKTIGDYFGSHTGTVTAANDYFILSKSEVDRLELNEWARPILKKGAYLPEGPVFSEDHFEEMAKNYPAYVLDFAKVTDPQPDAVKRYLKMGIERGIEKSYKARHRSVWYHVPIARTSSAFFFKRSHAYPRIILNRANALVTDTAYVLTATEGKSMEGLCYSFYNSVTLLFAEIEGRFYGGGVLELTPKEFRSLPLFYTQPTKQQFDDFSNHSRWRNPEALAAHGDELLVRDFGFSHRQLEDIRQCWLSLRAHRLRHGASHKLVGSPRRTT